MDTKD